MSVEVDFKGRAENTQGVVVGVEGTIDHGGDHAFGVMGEKGGFENAFSGTGFADDQAETTLLGVDEEDIEDVLLVGEQGQGFVVEGMALKAEV